MSNKKYGLIIPKQQKQQQLLTQRKTIFDDDDLEHDEEEDGQQLQMPQRSAPALIQMTSKANNVAKVEIKKALEEDPNVFAYDDIYDEMKSQKGSSAGSGKQELKKPKYMDNLLKSAELRKREKERREEKMIQKERELEGDMFQDKEAYVTTAYKEKLKELRETEAREKNEAAFEAQLDVKKQKDLSGFYRHLLNQQTGSEKVSEHSVSDRFEGTSSSLSANDNKNTFNKSAKRAQRNLRERHDSSGSDEEVPAKTDNEDLNAHPKPVLDDKEVKKDDDTSKSCETLKTESDHPNNEPEPNPEPLPPKIDRKTLVLNIFQKRTVGIVFEEALKRYHERKLARN